MGGPQKTEQPKQLKNAVSWKLEQMYNPRSLWLQKALMYTEYPFELRPSHLLGFTLAENQLVIHACWWFPIHRLLFLRAQAGREWIAKQIYTTEYSHFPGPFCTLHITQVAAGLQMS